jgi:hypothetical protein
MESLNAVLISYLPKDLTSEGVEPVPNLDRSKLDCLDCSCHIQIVGRVTARTWYSDREIESPSTTSEPTNV